MSGLDDGRAAARRRPGPRTGAYRGVGDGLTIELRVERDAAGADGSEPSTYTVSGDLARDGRFLASFVGAAPFVEQAPGGLDGPVVFRGNPGLFTGRVTVHTEDRGVGTFQISVDLEGGYHDVTAGRLDWHGSALRRLLIEVDGIEGTEAPLDYVGASGRRVGLASAFQAAGFDVTITVDPFRGRGPARARVRGFTLGEIHAAMEAARNQPAAPGRMHAHLYVCSYLAGRDGRGVLGVMYDFGDADRNRAPREGVAIFYDHPMLSDPRVSEDARRREYVFTAVHEVGHALNLQHSFDKARPAALSWMNYPDYFPFGEERPEGHDGTAEFWQQFPERFDEDELRHLRHGTPREVAAGGFAFGTYEEGVSTVFGGTAAPRRTVIGANPLRAVGDLAFTVEPLKREYALGEPVFVRLAVRNAGAQLRRVPDALDPADGFVRLTIRRPDGRVVAYRPPVRYCKPSQLVLLAPGTAGLTFDGAPLFLSDAGPVFTEPGTYLIRADLTGVDGSRTVASPAASLRVLAPDRPTERFAEEAWASGSGFRALYLRHPLAEQAGWQVLEGLAVEAELPQQQDNTTWAYLNYVKGLGWLTPFATPRTNSEQARDPVRAAARLRAAADASPDLRGLPSGVRRRLAAADTLVPTSGGGRPTARASRRGAQPVATTDAAPTVPTTAGPPVFETDADRARAAVPPAGLFAGLGLGVAPAPGRPADPFVRVVSGLRGSRAFADIVSWNIEHLHAPDRWEKLPRVARLIRAFRCDVWGLQEVDAESLAALLATLNSSGGVRYDALAVEGGGQQSGLLWRTDTTTIRRLPADSALFGEELSVPMRAGDVAQRRVFHRQPLLVDVRVRQAGGVVDFRSAVVHLKSTDTAIADTGNALREAAAAALARWVEGDQGASGERDYVIMGDMNAETAQQGLAPFAEGAGLELLSVGMQDRYGRAEALTRVASRRMLDHIVVTGDARLLLPEEDLGEQLVVRADTRVSDWIGDYSDHVPVAVRFVLGEDRDLTVSRAGVQGRVKDVLSGASGRSTSSIGPKQTLEGDLGLTRARRRGLASGFQDIATETNPDADVTPAGCEKLGTVRDAFDYVVKQATPRGGTVV